MSPPKILCVLVFIVGGGSASYKRWLPDTNFENPNNWNVKRAPCGNDVTIIPDDSPVVYVQMNTTIKELVLPMNGELILGQNIGLAFTQSTLDHCQDAGGDVEFTAVHPVPWFDPTSWCTAPTQTGNCDVTSMTLDVEKVPCTYDDVIFPRDHSYFVDLSEVTSNLSVKSLKIFGTSFTTSTLTSYFNSDGGKKMFRLPTTSTDTRFQVTRRECGDISGCSCGNDRPEVLSKICSHVSKTCPRPHCKDTIQPVGACCRMCGVLFNITRGYGFDLQAFKTNLKNGFFADGTNGDINMTSSVTSEGWLQLVLVDKTGDKSADLAKKIKADMTSDLANGGHKYAIDSFQMSLSTGSSLNPSSSKHQGVNMGGGSIAGIVLAVIIIIAVIILISIFIVYRRTGREIPKLPSIHMPNMPSLPRLPRRAPKATARVPPGVFTQPQTASHIDPGFANPLYDTSPFDDGNAVVKEMELIEAREEQPTFDMSDVGFNNPLYGTQGGSMFSDPTKTDGAEDAPARAKKVISATATSGASPVSDTAIIIEHCADNGDSTI